MGYTLALNVRHLTPQIYVSTYPDAWVAQYTSGRYVLLDPVALWCASHTGSIRWSEIKVPGLNLKGGVLGRAAQYGLKFGAVSSQRNSQQHLQRCALSVSREDRELETAEVEEISDILSALINGIGPFGGLDEQQLAVLSDLASGLQISKIAAKLDVSEPTVKRRIEAARRILGAKNAMQAVAIVSARGLLERSA